MHILRSIDKNGQEAFLSTTGQEISQENKASQANNPQNNFCTVVMYCFWLHQIILATAASTIIPPRPLTLTTVFRVSRVFNAARVRLSVHFSKAIRQEPAMQSTT